MTDRKRGRPQKHEWIEFKDLDNNYSPEAQYLKWASVNNSALARPGSYGCPQCSSKDFKLRHDKKFKNIRFYCQECGHETSFRIKKPPKHNLRFIQNYNDKGILIDEKTADDYHEKTTREIVDSAVLLAEQKLDLGGEWFNDVSGIQEQDRYLTLEEALECTRRNCMKAMLEAMLKETEYETEEDRLVDLYAETSRNDGKN
jgi:hypothetical protein